MGMLDSSPFISPGIARYTTEQLRSALRAAGIKVSSRANRKQIFDLIEENQRNVKLLVEITKLIEK